MANKVVYEKKQIVKALLIALLIVIAVILIMMLTVPIWLPLLIINIPTIAIFYFLSKYTKLGQPLLNIYIKPYDWLFYRSEAPRKYLWNLIYNTMCLFYSQTQWKAMNYGFAMLNNNGQLIKNLKKEDEDERFCLQLYHYCATLHGKIVNLNGLQVLEIGSGRGGGLNYISNYLNPDKCVGIDFSQNQILFCKSNYGQNNKLEFYVGDSENLDNVQGLNENTFDLAINIESSHCYGNFDKFLEQASKFVKPKGYLVIADFRSKEGIEQMKQSFQKNQWEIIQDEDITIYVTQALKKDEQRRIKLIEDNVNAIFRPFFKKFSGLQGSRIYEEFQQKKTLYWSFVLKNQKQILNN